MPIVNIDDLSLLSLTKATNWLRAKYNIGHGEIVEREFQQEFNCQILHTDWGGIRAIEFNTEQDYTMFMLRWG